MSIRKIFMGSLAAALVSTSAFASVFDYFEAIDDVIPDFLTISIEERVKHESNIYEASRNESTHRFTSSAFLYAVMRTEILSMVFIVVFSCKVATPFPLLCSRHEPDNL